MDYTKLGVVMMMYEVYVQDVGLNEKAVEGICNLLLENQEDGCRDAIVHQQRFNLLLD